MTEENAIVFTAGESPEEILKLTEEGMFYKGELVEDAGEAYRRFSEWLDSTDQFEIDETFELDYDAMEFSLEEEKE